MTKNFITTFVEKYNNSSVVLKATLWFTISSFVGRGVSLLTTPVISRLLTTSEYGIISVFNTWEGIFTVILTLYLYCGIQEVCIAKNQDDQNHITGSLMLLSLIILLFFFCIFMLFSPAFVRLLKLERKYLIIMITDIGACAITQFWFTQQRFLFAYKRFVGVTTLKCIFKALLGIFFVIWFPADKVFSRVLGLAIVDYIFAVPIFFILVKHVDFKRIPQYWLHALKFNIVLIPHYLSGILLSSSDRILIARIVGDGEAGIYAMMCSCAGIVSLFYGAVNSALTPYSLQCIQNKDYKSLNEKTYQSLLVTIGCSLLVVLAAPEALKIFAPDQYYKGVTLIPILLYGMYLNFFYLIFSNFEFYYEKKYYIALSTIFGAAINIILNYIFIPMFGYFAAAYTTLAGYIILAVIHYIIYIKITDAPVFNMKKIVLLLAVFGVFTVICTLLYPYFWIRFIIFIVLLAVIFWKRSMLLQYIKRS